VPAASANAVDHGIYAKPFSKHVKNEAVNHAGFDADHAIYWSTGYTPDMRYYVNREVS
jgi:hypothetical protein